MMSQRIAYNSVSPEGTRALGEVYRYVAESGLAADLVELVYLRISQINNCAFCLDMHTRSLIKKEMKIEKLALVQAWREAGQLFNQKEQAALAWAESVTMVAQTGIPDDVYNMTHAEFTDKELTDLTIAIGLMNTYNRLSIGFRSIPEAAL